ncbi:MAG: ABC transporter ATP-binding protein, partial [Candidatus Brocadiia bacterium]
TPQKVKGMMRSPLLEVKCAFPRRCASLLNGRIASHSIGIFGDTVHVAVDNAETAAAQIDSILTAAEGVKPEIRIIAPSLEDVFISVLGSGGEAGGAS